MAAIEVTSFGFAQSTEMVTDEAEEQASSVAAQTKLSVKPAQAIAVLAQ